MSLSILIARRVGSCSRIGFSNALFNPRALDTGQPVIAALYVLRARGELCWAQPSWPSGQTRTYLDRTTQARSIAVAPWGGTATSKGGGE